MVASIIKTTQIDKVPSVVNTGASGGMGLIRWGYTENVIIIITSSVPCIRPLFISSVRKVSSATRSWSHELSAAGRRSKNASSKSTSRNTWSKNESSGTREVSAGYAGKVDEEAGFGYGYGTEGETEVEGEIGVARGWSEENSLPGQDGLSGGGIRWSWVSFCYCVTVRVRARVRVRIRIRVCCAVTTWIRAFRGNHQASWILCGI